LDKDIKGVISAPQFDLNTFMPGTPIRVTAAGGSGEWYGFSENCLVVTAEPLSVKIAYIKTKTTGRVPGDEENRLDMWYTAIIPISLVAKGNIRIKFFSEIGGLINE